MVESKRDPEEPRAQHVVLQKEEREDYVDGPRGFVVTLPAASAPGEQKRLETSS